MLNQNAAMNSDPGAAGYIRIDPNQKFTIDEQGNIWQNRAVVGRVGVVDFANYNYLEKFGKSLSDGRRSTDRCSRRTGRTGSD